MTLMRNGRDRRSENPSSATRGKSACFWLGPISGSHQGQQPARLHSEAEYMAAPERFAKTSDSFPLHRGRRPYMALGRCTGMSAMTESLRGKRTRFQQPAPRAPDLMRAIRYAATLAAAADTFRSVAETTFHLVDRPCGDMAACCAHTAAGADASRRKRIARLHENVYRRSRSWREIQ